VKYIKVEQTFIIVLHFTVAVWSYFLYFALIKTNHAKYLENHVQCADGNGCIEGVEICNGIKNCRDKSDEGKQCLGKEM
jgi:hypothetical protein